MPFPFPGIFLTFLALTVEGKCTSFMFVVKNCSVHVFVFVLDFKES